MPNQIGPQAMAALNSLTDKTQLRVEFPDAAATVITPGTAVAPANAAKTPALAMATDLLLDDVDKKQRYMSVCVDLDAPFPLFPFLGPILHGVQTDLVAATTADASSSQWTPLTSEVPPVLPYSGPRPPPISAPHRYVFLVWPQPKGVDTVALRQQMGLAVEPVGLKPRIRWDGGVFEQQLGLGKPLACNYFNASGK